MNLVKALKLKAKLAKKADRAFQRFSSNNSNVKDSTVDYDPEESFKEYNKAIEDLIELKSKISIANAPIYKKIFMLSEYKSTVSKLKSVVTTNGMHRDRYGSEVSEEYVAFMTKVEVDSEIERLEELIEDTQSEIESFNSVTKI